MKELIVLELPIRVSYIEGKEYICISDIAKYKNMDAPVEVVKNWLRNKNTLYFLALWEKINNINFKQVEFDLFEKEAGLNHFVLSPKKWVEKTDAIGLFSRSGNNGGTYAHKDIALEFASWISPEFKLYLIKEFERLKGNEGIDMWSVRREIAKTNYLIHTDAIKENIVPNKIDVNPHKIYASEADILNMALFNMTAGEWRKLNPSASGNIRDYANISQLIVLSNLEVINASLIDQGKSQYDRLVLLNNLAIKQLTMIYKK